MTRSMIMIMIVIMIMIDKYNNHKMANMKLKKDRSDCFKTRSLFILRYAEPSCYLSILILL